MTEKMSQPNLTQLPSSIKISSVEWRIEYVNDEKSVNPDGDRILWGHVCWRDVTIRIFAGLRGNSAIWQTIWHEIFHILIHYFQLGVKDTEAFCEKMGVGMNDIYQQNFMPRTTVIREETDEERASKTEI